MRAVLLSLALVACGDNLPDPTPDAGAPSCCALYPDVAAIQACAATPHACGVLRCETPDGPVQIGVCGVANGE